MLLQPKKTKFKKVHKGKIKPYLIATRNIQFTTGNFALIACEAGRITSKQIETARISLQRLLRKIFTGTKKKKFILRIFPHIPVTAKPLAMRMGNGKGSVTKWIYRIAPREIILELSIKKSLINVAYDILTKTGMKFGIKTKIINKY
jgi:large subunit ribosomal protein L16